MKKLGKKKRHASMTSIEAYGCTCAKACQRGANNCQGSNHMTGHFIDVARSTGNLHPRE